MSYKNTSSDWLTVIKQNEQLRGGGRLGQPQQPPRRAQRCVSHHSLHTSIRPPTPRPSPGPAAAVWGLFPIPVSPSRGRPLSWSPPTLAGGGAVSTAAPPGPRPPWRPARVSLRGFNPRSGAARGAKRRSERRDATAGRARPGPGVGAACAAAGAESASEPSARRGGTGTGRGRGRREGLMAAASRSAAVC